jgi:phosphoribulokinase
MIVCGLHSLYTENQNLYNLKIFIDTHDTLKYTWKIKRDMQKRGYSKEQILNQIESRKNDYINYILPQRDKSDIIINFFTDDDFDINRLDEIPNIKLRIIIKKRFNLFPILKSFTSNSISYDFVVEDNYYYVVIDKFSDHNLNLNYISNNFYDYILYIILHSLYIIFY